MDTQCCCGKTPTQPFLTRLTDDGPQYWDRKKLPSGMTVEIAFTVHKGDKDELYVYPSLVIYRKRRNAWKEFDTLTGRDSLLPLVWARARLRDFEEYIFVLYRHHDDAHFYVEWEHANRGRAYRKVLSREGYYMVHEEGHQSLRKDVERPLSLTRCF